jgi:predicted RNase H-like HicB family nuclease
MVDAMKTFTVVFEHDEVGWHASIPEVQGCRTWGRSLSEARRHIREALSTCVDVFEDAAAVAAEASFVEDIRLPELPSRALAEVRAAAEAQLRAAEALRERSRAVAQALTATGLSLRDAGDLLGVSQEQVRTLLRPIG